MKKRFAFLLLLSTSTVAGAQTSDALIAKMPAIANGWKLNYSNFDKINVTDEPLIYGRMRPINGDQMWAIGKLCATPGAGSFIAIDVKKFGTGNDQYNLKLITMGASGAEDRKTLGTTQKANGNTVQVADLSVKQVGSNYELVVTTDGKRTETFPVSCR